MQVSYEGIIQKIEFYLSDLTEQARKEFITALNGDNGNYDVFPFATLELEADCPLCGDTANNCADCAYAEDYKYKNGECVRKSDAEQEAHNTK